MITKLIFTLLVILAKLQTPAALTYPDFRSASEHVENMCADLKKFSANAWTGTARHNVHSKMLAKYPEFPPEVRYLLEERVNQMAVAGELNAKAVDGFGWYKNHFNQYNNKRNS